MTTETTIALVAARGNPDLARSLHLVSLIRGRLDVLEASLARREKRESLSALLTIDDLFTELETLTLREAAA